MSLLKRFPRVERISERFTIISIAPFSSKNSLRWKPSGNFSRTVCSITRGPAKPINAFGSAMFTSPNIAKLADTPPNVGSVNTEINGTPFSRIFANTALVFAICIKEKSASCIRAPPLAEKQTNGQFNSIAFSAAFTNFEPTTEPIEPPMKLKLDAATTTGML